MQYLDATDESIIVTMANNAATTNPTFISNYGEISQSTGLFLRVASNEGSLNGTTAVPIVDAPDGVIVKRRDVKGFSIHNPDTLSVDIIISKKKGINIQQMFLVTLPVNYSIVYSPDGRISVYTNNGTLITSEIGEAINISFLPNGDITATDAQTAIQEVRDDTDTKLLGKANIVHTHDTSGIITGTFADARIAQSNIIQHEGAITHQNILGAGTNTHAQIDTHIADDTLHIFGTEYQYIEDDTVSTTTSTTFQLKLTMTTTNLPAGTYRLGINYGWNHNNVTNDFESRVLLNGVTNLLLHRQEPKDVAGGGEPTGTNQRYLAHSCKNIALSGVNTITVEYRTSNVGIMSSIWDTRIELWRLI